MKHENSSMTAGLCLKRGREEAHLTIKDVAQRLRLGIEIINAIEADNYDINNMPPVFMRGYLRAYARLVNLPEAQALTTYNSLHPNHETSVPITSTAELTSRSHRHLPLFSLPSFSLKISTIQWITVAIFVILFGLAALGWRTHNSRMHEKIAPNTLIPKESADIAIPLAQRMLSTNQFIQKYWGQVRNEVVPPAKQPILAVDLGHRPLRLEVAYLYPPEPQTIVKKPVTRKSQPQEDYNDDDDDQDAPSNSGNE